VTRRPPLSGVPGASKENLVAEIAALLGVENPGLSTGSTERKTLFVAANERLGLHLGGRRTKPDLARNVVESAGFVWRRNFESRGSTVTRAGLLAVRDAIRFMLRDD
jgi:hypothetical protein